MGKGKVGSNKYDYTPDKLSANEGLGAKVGATQYQMNTPEGLYTLANPAGFLMGANDLAGQHESQRQAREAKPGFEREAQSQGMQARQLSIASGTGGGGVQSQMDIQAYNGVMAQYAALRQALEAARIQQNMQMYGAFGQVAGAGGAGGWSGGLKGNTPGSLSWMGSGS